jgi:hypothetical protein
LVLALACSTLAGQIPYPGIADPPPSTITGDVQYPNVASPPATAYGDMQYPGATDSTLTETALNMLQSVLSLF